MRQVLPLVVLVVATVASADTAVDTATELTGEALVAEISGQVFDCRENDVDFLWQPGALAADGQTLPYVAVIKGKTFASHYVLNDAGRLVQSSNEAVRTVQPNTDGTLLIRQDNGREMTCRRR